MTSASELFYTRRSRSSRGAETNLGLDGVSSDRDRPPPIRRSFLRRRRNHFADADDSTIFPRALLRSGHEPHHSNDNSPGDSGTSSGINNGSIASERISRMLSASDGQLSSSVLQARARLLERLRGISIPQNRQDEAASSVPWDDEYWAVVVGRNSLEPGRQVSSSLRQSQSPLIGRTRGTSLRGGSRPAMASSDASFRELASFGDLVERIQSQLLDFSVEESQRFPVPQFCIRRSPGLSCDDIENLLHEDFEEAEDGDVGMQCDCSVCLESFQEGDGLLRLHCGHRFHSACLEPWLRICGDCPYCRARILIC